MWRVKSPLASTLAGTLVAFLVLIEAAGSASAQDASLGRQVWLTKVNCRDCHGWSGNGVPDNPQAPAGLSLRSTALRGDQLAEVIRCGRPGTPMPYFDRSAYTDDRCYGVTAAELGDQLPPPGAKTLAPREVAGLVAFIEAALVGKGPVTREECREMWGEETDRCEAYASAE